MSIQGSRTGLLDVGRFIVTLKDAARGTRKTKLSHLRFFLRFLYAQTITTVDLSLAIPSLRLGTPKRIPEPFAPEDADEFLKAIDRQKPHGKRDYAIVQMVSQLAMRSSDVRLLKFEHIDWNTGILRYAQNKTQQPIELPMSEELGLYLIDYLQNGRPNVVSDYVFLRDSAPYEPLRDLSDICRRYLKNNKNCTPKYGQGLHSFRHTLASRMLSEGIPLGVIAQMLGHVNNKTIGEYLRIDFKGLELCALDPEEVHKDE